MGRHVRGEGKITVDKDELQDLLIKAKNNDYLALKALLIQMQSSLKKVLQRKRVPEKDILDTLGQVEDKMREQIQNFRSDSIAAFWLWARRIAGSAARRLDIHHSRFLLSHDLDGQGAPTVGGSPEGFVGLDVDVTKALNTLSKAQQDVWILRDIEGYSHEEIQHLTRYNAKKVKKVLEKARTTLREYLLAASLRVQGAQETTESLPGGHVLIRFELSNDWGYPVSQVLVHIQVSQRHVSRSILNIPAHGTAILRQKFPPQGHTTPQSVVVTWQVGKAKFHKAVVINL
jgi:DNA-directed RNA polymerase specialized sigma24 family protein